MLAGIVVSAVGRLMMLVMRHCHRRRMCRLSRSAGRQCRGQRQAQRQQGKEQTAQHGSVHTAWRRQCRFKQASHIFVADFP